VTTSRKCRKDLQILEQATTLSDPDHLPISQRRPFIQNLEQNSFYDRDMVIISKDPLIRYISNRVTFHFGKNYRIRRRN